MSRFALDPSSIVDRDTRQSDLETSILVHDYLQLFRRNWRWIAATTVVSIAIALAHFFVSPRSFRATTTIQVEQRSLLGFRSDPNPWLEAWASVKYYPTQYRLLKSRGLAERVVLDLGLHREPAATSDDDAVTSLPERETEVDRALVASIASRLLAGLDVNPVAETELVEISFVASDPEQAARIANAFATAFDEWSLETRSETVGRASTFLLQQIESLKNEIDEKEKQLQQYSRRTDIINLDPSTNVTLQRLEQLNAEYTRALGSRFEKQARYNELKNSPPEAVADRTSGALVNAAKTKLAGLEQEYQAKLEIYTPDWPEMVERRSEIEDARSRLQTLVEEQAQEAIRAAYAEYQTALREERSLENQIGTIRAEVMSVNSAAVEFKNLEMEIDNKRELLDELSRRQAETGVSASLLGTRESNIRVIDRALVPQTPFRPSLQKNLALGLSGGLALGIGLVLLVHMLDRTIKSSEELERLLGHPVLAAIPDVSSSGRGYGGYGYAYGRREEGTASTTFLGRRRNSQQVSSPTDIELLPAMKPRLAVSEAYRSLRTALLLSSADKLQVVTITSAEVAEGKTATAANLAIVMAQLGRRVLLVDADLRKPRLHKVFNESNRHGLVNFLAGGDSADSFTRPTSISGLSLCTSGPLPPNPSELLASERMEEFLQLMRSRFEFIIIDSPPVLAVTDAILPGSLGDGVVLCLRAHKVLREDIRSCRKTLERAEVKILGAVLNRYQPSRSGAYGRKYHYYESYSADSEDAASDSAA